jgi:phosphatidylserine decarboxylase
MSQLSTQSLGPLGQISIGERAARTLTAELARHAGPKTACWWVPRRVAGALGRALDALQPGDRLTVVSAKQRVSRTGRDDGQLHPRSGSRVAFDLSDAEPADVVIVAEPVVGSGEEARGTVEQLSKLVATAALLVIAAVALPGLSGGPPTNSTASRPARASAPISSCATRRRCACTGCASPRPTPPWRPS